MVLLVYSATLARLFRNLGEWCRFMFAFAVRMPTVALLAAAGGFAIVATVFLLPGDNAVTTLMCAGSRVRIWHHRLLKKWQGSRNRADP
jgi:hypothetical protein